jgi:hypothetical protein
LNIFDIFLSAFNQLGSFFYFIIFILFISFILKNKTIKGMLGEFIVNFIISKKFNKHKYRLLKNVTLNTEDGTTQIDHIIVSQYGIFVLETKNMKGWIFGKEKDKVWTQQIFKKKFKFQNPLLQNYKHTQTISKNFNIPNKNIKSLIIFVGSAKFKTKLPKNVFSSVFKMVSYINSHQVIKYTNVETFDIYRDIKNGRLPNTIATHRNHVNHLNEKIKKKMK